MRSAAEADRGEGLRRGLTLEVFTVAWNLVEAAVAVTAGVVAGSVALVGFGFDSLIEVTAGAFVLRRLRAEIRGAGEARVRAQGRTATRVVGITFLVLAAYILFRAGGALLHREPPDQSTVGIVLSVASLLVMPWLAWRKLSVGRELGSASLVADAKETLVCAYLSFALLLGLGLHAWMGWWWADPVAALAMVPLILHEGWEAIHESGDG